MSMAPPVTFGVVEEQELYVVKEQVPGTPPASIGSPLPFTKFQPSDKPMMIDDDSYQGAMVDIYGEYQGPLIAAFDMAGHVTLDLFPLLVWNILGDYTATGTAASPASTTNASVVAGATALPVASGGTSFTNGMNLWLEDAGSPAANELVTVTATGSATSIPVTATRFAHATAMPFTNTTAPYVHTFATLNGSVGAWAGPAQGPTICFTHRNGLANNNANVYAYGVLTELVITGNSEKLLDYTAKGIVTSRQAPGSSVGFANVSTVNPVPAWRSTTGVGGTVVSSQVKTLAEWEWTIGRKAKAFNTDQGSQQPYIIARGAQSLTGKNTVLPAIDDTNLTALLANSQPQLQVIHSNGLTGASLLQIQLDTLMAAYQTADITSGDVLFGVDVPWKGVGTNGTANGVTLTGASGGKSNIKVTITNAVPGY